jgi:hypothetical protein
MSSKEIERVLIFNEVQEKRITLLKAAELIKLSYPQTKRLWSRFKKEGKKGLISKKRGKPSNRSVPHQKCQEIISIISKEYQLCSPSFISEKLCEKYSLNFSSEFIRQLMIKHNLWIPRQKKTKVHQRRMRRECEGELEQIDASDHNWLEDRGPRCHLHLLVDDATSKIMGGHFALEETTEGYFKACLPYFEKIGRPRSLYSDKRGTFIANKSCRVGETQFARAMKELDIQMITAHSPQAKGRIERVFGTLQKRLVWEMRLNNISTLEEANAFLPSFFEAYNTKFSKQPANPFNAHRPLNHEKQLKYILCKKEKRIVTKNLEISYENRIYQLFPPEKLMLKIRKNPVTIITTLDNELLIQYDKVFIKYMIYNEQPYVENCISINDLLNSWKTKKKYKPPKSHPYKRIKLG